MLLHNDKFQLTAKILHRRCLVFDPISKKCWQNPFGTKKFPFSSGNHHKMPHEVQQGRQFIHFLGIRFLSFCSFLLVREFFPISCQKTLTITYLRNYKKLILTKSDKARNNVCLHSNKELVVTSACLWLCPFAQKNKKPAYICLHRTKIKQTENYTKQITINI